MQSQFISLDVETELTSRKQQLLKTIGVEDRYNLRLRYNDPQNINTITEAAAVVIGFCLIVSTTEKPVT